MNDGIDSSCGEMEKKLLPVFEEAVKLCKKLTNNNDFFKQCKNTKRLYAIY